MILTYGDTSKLGNTHWYMVELRSEKTVEGTLRRIGAQISSIFRESSVEVFVPVFRRDLNVFELKTGNYLFARSASFQSLLRLKSITGVVGLVTLGDSNHPSKAIPVDNAYVQAIIAEAEEFFRARASAIAVGSFVRIIDGDQRDFCGTVMDLHDGMACVQIDIKTKIMLVETPVRNLLDLDHVAQEERVFYYAPLVNTLESSERGPLLSDDLKFSEDPLYADDGLSAPQTGKLTRQQTVTALVKRLILTGTLAPSLLALEVVQALKEGKLRKPKNLSIVHGVIKQRLIQDHFAKLDSNVDNYRDVVVRFGSEWKFPLSDLVAVAQREGLQMDINEESSATIQESAA